MILFDDFKLYMVIMFYKKQKQWQLEWMTMITSLQWRVLLWKPPSCDSCGCHLKNKNSPIAPAHHDSVSLQVSDRCKTTTVHKLPKEHDKEVKALMWLQNSPVTNLIEGCIRKIMTHSHLAVHRAQIYLEHSSHQFLYTFRGNGTGETQLYYTMRSWA